MSEHHGTRIYFLFGVLALGLFGVLALGLFGVAVAAVGVNGRNVQHLQATMPRSLANDRMFRQPACGTVRGDKRTECVK